MTHRAVFMGPERSSSEQAELDFDRLLILLEMFAPDLVGSTQTPLGPEAFAEVEARFQRVREDCALREARKRAPPPPPPPFGRLCGGRKERA